MGCPVVRFEIGCRDAAATSRFYCELFGWETRENNPFSVDVDTRSDGGLPGAITSLGHEPHNYMNIYVQVPDLDAYCKKLTSLGGSVMIPPTEIPGGQGRFSWVNDPEGQLFAMYEPPAA